MPNLMEVVDSRTQLSTAAKSMRVCLIKSDLKISAAASNAARSKRYFLVRFPVRKLPLLAIDASAEKGKAIVIDANSRRVRATNSGYVPRVVILCGLDTLRTLKTTDKNFCNVWVGEKALKKLHISAEDCIGSNALQSKLQRCISDKYKKAKADGSYSPTPWIEEIFPFDNYFVFRYDGENYRQTFSLDKKTQEPSLVGEPVKAIIKYVPAISAASLADVLYPDTYLDRTTMQELTLDRVNQSGPTLGRINYNPPFVPDGTYYPVGSELSQPELKTMLNVHEALSIFLTVLKDGMKGPLQQMFQPVTIPTDKFLINACREAEIAAKEAHRKINVHDFVNWQHNTLTKKGTPTKYGLAASAYAYIGDRYDISTWHLRADSPEEIKKSIHKVMECSGIPESKRPTIKLKLKAMLKR